jgi:transposase
MACGGGGRRRFRAWIFTAVLSRHRFVYPVGSETTASAIEACEAAWAFFGGVFKVVIPDNTKTIVNTADPLEAKITRDFLEYAQSRGFQVDPTRVRSPRTRPVSNGRQSPQFLVLLRGRRARLASLRIDFRLAHPSAKRRLRQVPLAPPPGSTVLPRRPAESSRP